MEAMRCQEIGRDASKTGEGDSRPGHDATALRPRRLSPIAVGSAIAAGVALLLCAAPRAQAQSTVSVSDAASLVNAVNGAADGDTILVGPGVLVLNQPLIITKSVTIQAASRQLTAIRSSLVEVDTGGFVVLQGIQFMSPVTGPTTTGILYSPVFPASGGYGSLRIVGCTIFGFVNGVGAVLANSTTAFSVADVFIVNSTITDNGAGVYGYVSGYTAGSQSGLRLSLDSATVSDNGANFNVVSQVGNGGIDVGAGASLTVLNSIVAFNAGDINAPSGGYQNVGSMIGGNPKLLSLADNGGSTWTMMPQADSPVIGQVPMSKESDDTGPTDQRGVARMLLSAQGAVDPGLLALNIAAIDGIATSVSGAVTTSDCSTTSALASAVATLQGSHSTASLTSLETSIATLSSEIGPLATSSQLSDGLASAVSSIAGSNGAMSLTQVDADLLGMGSALASDTTTLLARTGDASHASTSGGLAGMLYTLQRIAGGLATSTQISSGLTSLLGTLQGSNGSANITSISNSVGDHLASNVDALFVALPNPVGTGTLQVPLTLAHRIEDDIEAGGPTTVFLVLPARFGGHLEMVAAIVHQSFTDVEAAGFPTVATALTALTAADTAYAAGQWAKAYSDYVRAYRTEKPF
jgi:hypothetical protein